MYESDLTLRRNTVVCASCDLKFSPWIKIGSSSINSLGVFSTHTFIIFSYGESQICIRDFIASLQTTSN